jgi:hypothetical protein
MHLPPGAVQGLAERQGIGFEFGQNPFVIGRGQAGQKAVVLGIEPGCHDLFSGQP